MYRDIEEKLASYEGVPYMGKEKWNNGLPIGLKLSTGVIIGR